MKHHEFSHYVKQRAKARGLTLSELARRTGISRQGLHGLLDGAAAQAKMSTLIALARALKVHPVILFQHLLSQLDFPKFVNTAAKYDFDANGFIQDVTIPNNTMVATNQVFTKVWEIQNIGHVDWVGRQLVCMDRKADITMIPEYIDAPELERGLIPTKRVIDIPITPSGGSVQLSVEFTAPAYCCSVVSYWKMVDEQGEFCFPETKGLSCLVQVVSL